MSLDHRALRESLVLRPEAAADHEAVDVLTNAAFGADGEIIGHVACSEYFQAKPLPAWRDGRAGPFAYAPAFSDL